MEEPMDADEESEKALLEVEEYVKISAILCFSELGQSLLDDQQDTHRTLVIEDIKSGRKSPFVLTRFFRVFSFMISAQEFIARQADCLHSASRIVCVLCQQQVSNLKSRYRIYVQAR